MPRNATPSNADPLTTQQLRAIAELIAGRSVTAAAAAVEIDRTTLHRWLRADFEFQAELNRLRREAREAIQLRLEHLADQAADVVVAAVQAGDTRAALAVLRGLGLLPSEPIEIGTDDPVVLQQEAEIAECEAANRRALRSLLPL
jgi:hypothetical protein